MCQGKIPDLVEKQEERQVEKEVNRELYIKIAFWYYNLHLTQDEIARRLNITRQKVNQMINSMQEMGIVSIHINGYEQEYTAMENRLEEQFGLNEVIIASDYEEAEYTERRVADIAGQYLDRTIKNGDVVGVSWGKLLAAVVDSMSYQRKNKCSVLQLVGAQNMNMAGLKSDEIARGMANKLNCPSYMLYAPVVVEYPETKQMLMKEKSIRTSFEQMTSCTIGIFGIGELDQNSTMRQIGYLSIEDIEHLRRDGFCADISMNPIRQDGSYDHCYLEDRLLNADMDCLKKIDNVVAVASGVHKARAILAVLRSGCLNTLILDIKTAERVIALMGEDETI